MRPDEIIRTAIQDEIDAYWRDGTRERNDFGKIALLALEGAGLVVVPKVATDEMLRAGDDDMTMGITSRIWSAMLTASQSPPAKEG